GHVNAAVAGREQAASSLLASGVPSGARGVTVVVLPAAIGDESAGVRVVEVKVEHKPSGRLGGGGGQSRSCGQPKPHCDPCRGDQESIAFHQLRRGGNHSLSRAVEEPRPPVLKDRNIDCCPM